MKISIRGPPRGDGPVASINHIKTQHLIDMNALHNANRRPRLEGIQAKNRMLKRLLAMVHSLFGIMTSFALFFVSFPGLTNANTIEYNIVTDEFYGLNADRILLVSNPDVADKRVKVVGRCKGRGATDLYLEDDPTNARETWFVVNSSSDLEPDLSICLSGNAPSWFEKAANPYG